MRLDDKEIMLLWEQGVAGSNPATPTYSKTLESLVKHQI